MEINDNNEYITADEGITINPEQSSTGNEYGVYDLSGNASECTAAYYNGSELLGNGKSFASKNGKSDEFSTAYSLLSYIEGDGTEQTEGWDGCSGKFPDDLPFFRHGGNNQDGDEAGVFCFWEYSGNPYDGDGFRSCLAIK